MSTRVGIVGAGITGLALTHALAKRGVDSVTYEAAGEPGGVIDSRVVDGRVLEVGPQRLRLTDAVSALVDDVGLREDLVVADNSLPLYVYADGALRLVPRSPAAFLRTDLLSWPAKLRVLCEPLTREADPEESVESLFVRKFGREAYRNLVEPVLGGTFGSNPAAMPVKHALGGVVDLEQRRGNLLVPALERVLGSGEGETPPPASFEGGLQQLPRAIAAEHDDRIRLDAPVEAVRETHSDAGVLVETANHETERFDHVVVTAPARAAADVFAEGFPGAAAALDGLTYNPLALVHLVSDAGARGYGYQVERDGPLRTLGVSWNESLFGRDGVYTAFLGGMDDPEILALDEQEIGTIAAHEFEQVMNASADAIHVERWPWAFPAYDGSWDALERVDLPERVHLATNYTARMGIPARVREAQRLAERFASD